MAETLSVTSMLANKFEPKRKFRWIMQIEGIDAFLLKSAARPSANTEAITIDWLNVKRYLAGKMEWQPISVVLHDAIAPSGAQQIWEWVRLSSETVSGRSGYADFYKRDIALKLLDPLGTAVEHWDIKGAWITECNMGELSYDSNDTADITISIKYDNAVLQW